MSYCADADVALEIDDSTLKQLCPDGSGGLSTAKLANRRARADSDINSILGPDFDVDALADEVAEVIKYAAVDLTVFYCYERKPEFKLDGGKNPEQGRYDRAIRTLQDIKSGKRDLGRETPAPTRTPTSAGGTVYASTGHFITNPDESSTGPIGGY